MELMNTWQELISIGLIGCGLATFFQKKKSSSIESETETLTSNDSILEENQHLKLILSNAQKDAKIGTWELNLSSKNLVWSDEMHNILETDRNTKPTLALIKSMVHKKDLKDFESGIRKILDGSISKKTKYRVNTLKGKVKYISVKVEVVKNPSKNGLTKILGTAQDVTKQAQITGFLSKTKNNYNLLTETLPVGIYRSNTKGELIFANQRMVEMFGFSSISEMKSYPCANFYKHKSDRDLMLDNLETNGILQDYHIHCKRKDGSTFVVTETCQVQNNELHGVVQDITARSKSEDEKNTLISTLKKQNEDYETFAHIISHNLRIPLVNIMGLTEIFDTKSMKEDNKEVVELMKQSTRNLDMIIKDLNKTISIREKKHEHYKIISLFKVFEEIRLNLDDQISAAGTCITTSITANDYVFSIPEFIKNILIQIIDNSIKFRSQERPSKIHIGFSQNNSSNILTIEDNGIGIDMNKNNDRLFKLYEKFYPELEGRGVGLYMTYNHVNALNGSISITSEINVGTKVSLILPNAEN